MAEGNFLSRLFGLDGEKSNPLENQGEDVIGISEETTELSIQDAESFVSELQSYYYNDICKMQADIAIYTTLTHSRKRFFEKKIKQEQVALSQIDEILKSIRENERDYQNVWKKSIYSFYDEIESTQLSEVQVKIYKVLVRLCEVNTKPELDAVISSRLVKYKEAWKITEDIPVPKNFNPILIDENNGIETYQFGSFKKMVFASETDRVLSAKQLDGIRSLKFGFGEPIQTDTVFVRVSSVTRVQLNYLRRTCILKNDWEYVSSKEDDDGLYFDVVNVKDLETYLKSILQIVLTKRNHAVITIIIPIDLVRKAIVSKKGLKE